MGENLHQLCVWLSVYISGEDLLLSRAVVQGNLYQCLYVRVSILQEQNEAELLLGSRVK